MAASHYADLYQPKCTIQNRSPPQRKNPPASAHTDSTVLFRHQVSAPMLSNAFARPNAAFPSPSITKMHQNRPIIRPRLLPIYLFKTAYGSGEKGEGCERRGIVVVAMLGAAGVEDTAGNEGRRSRATIGLWSEVVYDGIEVYRSDVTADRSGESLCVAYKMRSVHEGTRFSLLDRKTKRVSCETTAKREGKPYLYWSTWPILNL